MSINSDGDLYGKVERRARGGSPVNFNLIQSIAFLRKTHRGTELSPVYRFNKSFESQIAEVWGSNSRLPESRKLCSRRYGSSLLAYKVVSKPSSFAILISGTAWSRFWSQLASCFDGLGTP